MITNALRACLALGALTQVFACGGHSSYVESDSTLGRVVIYRNGVAFYERQATVKNQTVQLTVPRDKVNDFLKSLTVVDAATGKPLPVSYPTRGASQGKNVHMTIQLPPGPTRKVVLTYITEAPSWKPSYRLVIGADGKVKVQGWAIVDNTSGEDWKRVKVGVGSSSAMSFKYDLRSVRHVHRQTLADERRFAVAPPRGRVTTSAKSTTVFELADADIPKPAGHPGHGGSVSGDFASDRTASTGAPPAPTARAGSRRARRAYAKVKAAEVERARKKRLQQQRARNKAARMKVEAESKVRALAKQLKRTRGSVTIEGYSGKKERNGRAQSLTRANNLRNQLIRHGVAPGRLHVNGRGWVRGRAAGVRLVNAPSTAPKDSQGRGADGSSDPVGESHFMSSTRLSVARGTSAMVAIVDARTEGESVYLYNADGTRGNERFAFKSVRFVNPTESTLETGPVTVYGKGRFIGEGLADPIPPRATAIIPYALDRQVVVDRKHSTDDRIERLLTMRRGVFTAEVRHTKTTRLKITNRLHKSAKVYVRHLVDKGWRLVESPKVFDQLGNVRMFELTIGPKKSTEFVIRQATPLRQTVHLNSSVGLDLVRVFVRSGGNGNAKIVAQLKRALAIYEEMVNHRQVIENIRERNAEYRSRADELHTQIVSLKEVKAGSSLLRHLQKKMKDVSERIQKGTLDIVTHQEKMMLARVRFQDTISELTLRRPATAKSATKRPPA